LRGARGAHAVGVIIHTGDFKIDQTPPDEHEFDLHAFARYGRKACWRSSATARIRSAPDIRVGTRRQAALEELFRAAPRKVLVSCFASSIHRIQQVIDVAASVGRKVVSSAKYGGQR